MVRIALRRGIQSHDLKVTSRLQGMDVTWERLVCRVLHFSRLCDITGSIFLLIVGIRDFWDNEN